MLFSIVLTIGLLITGTNGFDSNSGTCNAATPLTDSSQAMTQNMRTQLSGASSNFALSVTPTSIVPGQNHTITLMRSTGSGGFRGLLLYVEDVSQTRIGTYYPVPGQSQTMPASPVFVGTCGGTTTTLTHTSTSSFTANQDFIWTAPATVNGPVTINAIAYETGVWIFNVPSPLTVPVSSGPPPGTPGPSSGPTGSPATTMPSSTPTGAPSANPSTTMPSKSPSAAPSKSPSTTPSKSPSTTPSKSPTMYPTSSPGTSMPSSAPSKSPSQGPSKSPSMSPTSSPATTGPSKSPSNNPSMSPTRSPFTREPSKSPTQTPSMTPSMSPSTSGPTGTPSTSGPTSTPVTSPPSVTPTKGPSMSPSVTPTAAPTLNVLDVCGTNATTTLGFGISFAALENGNQAAIYVVGPTAGWFAVGFGTNMIGSIALIAQVGQNVGVYTPLNTRDLAGVGSPRVDVANFTKRSDVVTNTTRAICLLFDTNQPAGVIDFTRDSVPVIFATSTTDGNLTAAGHGTNRGETAVVPMRTYSTTRVPGTLGGGASRIGGMWALAVVVGVLGYVGFV